MVSYRACPLATGTGLAINFLLAILVDHTVVMGLLEGEIHAVIIVVAGTNAVFEVLNIEGVNEDAFTLESPMTCARRTQPFTTDAIRTDDLVWFSRFGAVCEQDTETLFWLIGPPVAALV